MKTIFLLSLLVTFTAAGQAQMIQLEEAKVNYSPGAIVISSESGRLVLDISEAYKGQFSQNPLKFMKESFDILPFIASQKEEFDSYIVDFRSTKGHLRAIFDHRGELVRTFQVFRNHNMPLNLKRDIYENYKGWTITNYKYVASGRKNKIEKELYKIKLVNGNEEKVLKIRPERVARIASID